MADIDIIIDGVPQRIPEWALEETQQQVLTELRNSSRMQQSKLDKLISGVKKLTDEIIDLGGDLEKVAERAAQGQGRSRDSGPDTSDLDDSVDELTEILEDLGQTNIQFGSILGNVGETVGSALGSAAGTAMDFAATLGRAGLSIAAGALSTAIYGSVAAFGLLVSSLGAVLISSFDFAKSLNNLTSIGLGFQDVLGSTIDGFYNTVSGLSELTGSFMSAVDLLSNTAPSVIAQGVDSFTRSMRTAADASDELGVSIENSMERFGRALAARQTLLDLGNLDQIRLNQQIENSVRIQQAYSRALGVSSEVLQEFANNLITDNGMLAASLLRFNDTLRSDVISGIESFAITMRGLGGKAGGDIAEAFVEAASLGAMGFSETAMGFVAVLPRLSNELSSFIGQVQTAGITQESAQQITQRLATELGNLTDSERQRIFMLARSGDQYALTMARAITQFEQSRDRIDDINQQLAAGLDIFEVQKGTNRLTRLINNITGAFSSTFYSLFAGDEFFQGFSEALEEITPQVQTLARGVGQAVLNLLQSENIKTAFSRINSFLIASANSFSDFVDGFINENGSINWQVMWSGIFKTIQASIPQEWQDKLNTVFDGFDQLTNKVNNILNMDNATVIDKIADIFQLLYQEIMERLGKPVEQAKFAAGGALAGAATAATAAAIVSGPLAPIAVPLAAIGGGVAAGMYGWSAGGQVYDREQDQQFLDNMDSMLSGLNTKSQINEAQNKAATVDLSLMMNPATPTFVYAQPEAAPPPAPVEPVQPPLMQSVQSQTEPNDANKKLLDTLDMLTRTSEEQQRATKDLMRAVRDMTESL